MADAKELRNGRGQVHWVRVEYHAIGFAVQRRWFGAYFPPPVLNWKIKMHDASPGASVGSSSSRIYGDRYGDWCRCRFGLGKIPGSSAKKGAKAGIIITSGACK